MSELKKLYLSARPEVPMLVIPFLVLDGQRKLRRSRKSSKGDTLTKNTSRGCMTVALDDVPGHAHIVYLGWQLGREVQSQEGEWDLQWGDVERHKLVCSSLRKLAVHKNWDVDSVHVWIPSICVNKDDEGMHFKVVESLRSYMAVCSAMLIPSPEMPPEGAMALNQVPASPSSLLAHASQIRKN